LAPPEWPITAKLSMPSASATWDASSAADPRSRPGRGGRPSVARPVVGHPAGTVPGSGGQRLRRLSGVGRAVVPEHGEWRHRVSGAGVIDVQRSPIAQLEVGLPHEGRAYFGRPTTPTTLAPFAQLNMAGPARTGRAAAKRRSPPRAQEGSVAAPEVRSRAHHRRTGAPQGRGARWAYHRHIYSSALARPRTSRGPHVHPGTYFRSNFAWTVPIRVAPGTALGSNCPFTHCGELSHPAGGWGRCSEGTSWCCPMMLTYLLSA
jgi:hypothetical protein